MKIRGTLLGIIIIVIMAGTVFTTTALGLWQTTTAKIPIKYQTGDAKGQYNPDDIRGSYSFGDISKLFEIPIDDLATAFGVENKSTFLCKDLEGIYVLANESGKEVGTTSVGIFVALYKGLPIELVSAAYFPNSAEAVLIKAGKMTEVQKAFISSHLVAIEKVSANNVATTASKESENFVKGKTTFREVIAIGVKKEAIEAVLKTTIPDTSTVIKDFCTENGLEFTTIKAAIQDLIDKK